MRNAERWCSLLLVLLVAFLAGSPAQARLAPTGEPFVLTSLEGRHTSPILAARPDGTYLMVWNVALPTGPALYGGFFGPSGAPLAPPFEIQAGVANSPALSILPDGGFVIVWDQASELLGSIFDRDGHVRVSRFQIAAGEPSTPPMNPSVAVGADGSLVVLWQQGEFQRINADGQPVWPDVSPHFPRVPEYGTHHGIAIDPAGRLLTGDVRTYRNPAGTLASHADVQAFPPSAEARETVAATLDEIPVLARSTVEPLSPPITCHSSEVALCLDPLYQVTVDFVDPQTGEERQARAVPFSQESGAFWFFDQDNLELFVKVLDGTAVNGRAWVFHGALTDVEYTITVRDLAGAEWTYHNPRGRMHSGADTSALPPPSSLF